MKGDFQSKESDREFQLKKAEYFININKPDMAVKEALSRLYEDPEDGDSYILLAKAYALMGKHMDAEHAVKEAIGFSPDNDYYHMIYGIILWCIGDNAEEEFKKAIELDPSSDEYYALYAIHLKFISGYERIDEIEDLALHALKNNPNNIGAHNILASVYKHKGDIKKAMDEYRASLRIDPTNSETLNDYGVLLYTNDKREEAKEIFTQILRMDPMDKFAEENLVICYKLDSRMYRPIYKFAMKLKHSSFRERMKYYIILIVLPYISWILKDAYTYLTIPANIFSILYLFSVIYYFTINTFITIKAIFKLSKILS